MDALERREQARSNMEKATRAHTEHGKEYAKYEREYRMLLAKTILKLEGEGYKVTLIVYLAEGNIEVAQAKERRNIEHTLVKSAENAIVNYRKVMEQYHADYKLDFQYHD